MFYFFKRKYLQIRNVFRWLPIIWNQFDFDYSYAIEVFQFQLTKIADFLESNQVVTLCAKQRAQRLRMVLRLMDKVYNEEYSIEYMDEMKKLYGKFDIKFIPTKNKKIKLFKMITVWEKNYTKEEKKEMENIKKEMYQKCDIKQKRAHKLLWKLIEHNIYGWWD